MDGLGDGRCERRVRAGIDSRVDSQTPSAGSGLMDNVPLVHKLILPTHDWYSYGVCSHWSSLMKLLQLCENGGKNKAANILVHWVGANLMFARTVRLRVWLMLNQH